MKPAETKALGWYAVRWSHINDWFKAHRKRQSSQTEGQTEKMQNTGGEQSSAAQSKTRSTTKKEEDKLHEAVHETFKTLATARSVFPFEIFPDIVTVDQHKLTIVYRKFFGIEQSVSVPIDNIKNVQADVGPFFGSITITSDHFINNTQTVNWLWRHDAEEIQRLLQGVMVAVKEGIDISKIDDTKELKTELTSLGEGRTDKKPN